MKKKLWSGRFTAETHHMVELYTASIGFDIELVYEDLLGSMAHIVMLKHCEIINDKEYHQLQQGLDSITQKFIHKEAIICLEDEDIHMNIERLLHESIGDVAGKLHTARSRNDQVALDLHLYLRKHILFIVELLVQLQRTILHLAHQHQMTLLPSYTHLQRAQPITLALHWLAYCAMLDRDISRLIDSLQRNNQSPLGACALAGTTFNTDPLFTAKLLGFNDIYFNTIDAVSDRDFIIEFLGNCSLIMMHLSRFSEELILWSSQEFNFISFNDAFCTGSSIMPQKKNPDVAELARGKTGRVYGALFNLLTLLKGQPLAYNKDLQEDKEALFDTIKTVSQTLAIYSPLLESLTVNQESMKKALSFGFLNATIFAEYLAKKGLSFRIAHEVVGKMVAYCINKSCRLEDLSLSEFQEFSPLISDEIYDILNLEKITRDKQGNDFFIQIDYFQKQMQKNENWLKTNREFLNEIYHKFQVPLVAQI